MNRIMMNGVGGMLGKAFYEEFKNDYTILATDKDVNESWLQLLDFRDKDCYQKMASEFQPNYIFHIGAHTNLEYCEENKDDCYLTNTISVQHAVEIANQMSIPLVFISTAGIFDGAKDLYDDWDIPNPLGHYARSKVVSERLIQDTCKHYYICRAGWMMGGGIAKDKKFIGKIIRQISAGTDRLQIVNDKDGTPTYTVDFVRNVKKLINKNSYGVYNLVCGGETSRLEVAKELLVCLNREDIEIQEVASDFFSAEYFAARPRSERLVNYKLNLLGLNQMRDWKVCLAEYVNSNFQDLIND